MKLTHLKLLLRFSKRSKESMLPGWKIMTTLGNTAIPERPILKEIMKWKKSKRELFMWSLKTNIEDNLVWSKLLSGWIQTKLTLLMEKSRKLMESSLENLKSKSQNLSQDPRKDQINDLSSLGNKKLRWLKMTREEEMKWNKSEGDGSKILRDSNLTKPKSWPISRSSMTLTIMSTKESLSSLTTMSKN